MKKVTEIAVSRHATKKTRAAAYCRVSTDSDAQLESLDTQKSHYEQYISAHDGWELAGIYYDATVIIGLKQNPTHGRRFSPIFFA